MRGSLIPNISLLTLAVRRPCGFLGCGLIVIRLQTIGYIMVAAGAARFPSADALFFVKESDTA
jgi:hypothetical protein